METQKKTHRASWEGIGTPICSSAIMALLERLCLDPNLEERKEGDWAAFFRVQERKLFYSYDTDFPDYLRLGMFFNKGNRCAEMEMILRAYRITSNWPGAKVIWMPEDNAPFVALDIFAQTVEEIERYLVVQTTMVINAANAFYSGHY